MDEEEKKPEEVVPARVTPTPIEQEKFDRLFNDPRLQSALGDVANLATSAAFQEVTNELPYHEKPRFSRWIVRKLWEQQQGHADGRGMGI